MVRKIIYNPRLQGVEMGFFRSLFGGRSSLADSAAKAYFEARQEGHGHESALRKMVLQRYDSAPFIRGLVMEVFEEKGFGDRGNVEQLKRIVDAMYAQEQGIPMEWEAVQARTEEINQAIEKHKKGYPDIL